MKSQFRGIIYSDSEYIEISYLKKIRSHCVQISTAEQIGDFIYSSNVRRGLCFAIIDFQLFIYFEIYIVIVNEATARREDPYKLIKDGNLMDGL